jgi:hypothetical protein
MQWDEIRRHYPDQWLLLEAIVAHSEGNMRIPDQLAVIAAFADSDAAMARYAQLHTSDPQRELYVFHTSRSTLHITEYCRMGLVADSQLQHPLPDAAPLGQAALVA